MHLECCAVEEMRDNLVLFHITSSCNDDKVVCKRFKKKFKKVSKALANKLKFVAIKKLRIVFDQLCVCVGSGKNRR